MYFVFISYVYLYNVLHFRFILNRIIIINVGCMASISYDDFPNHVDLGNFYSDLFSFACVRETCFFHNQLHRIFHCAVQGQIIAVICEICVFVPIFQIIISITSCHVGGLHHYLSTTSWLMLHGTKFFLYSKCIHLDPEQSGSTSFNSYVP